MVLPKPLARTPFPLIAQAVWRYTAGHHGKLFLLILLAFLGHAVGLIAPYAIGEIVNALQKFGTDGTSLALKWVAVLGVAKLITLACESPANALELFLTNRAYHAFIQDTYNKIRHLPLQWHQDNHSGDIISRINKGYSALINFIRIPFQSLWLGIGFFGPLLILCSIVPFVGMIILCVSLTAICFAFLIDQKVIFHTKQNNEIEHRIFASLTDYIGNIRTIITLRLGLQTADDVQKRAASAQKTYHNEIKWRFIRWISIDTFVEATLIIATIAVILLFQKDGSEMQIGDMVMVITYLRTMSMAVYNTTRFLTSVTDSVANYQSIEKLHHDYDTYQRALIHDDTSMEQSWSSLAVNNLSFTYDTRPALTDISFTIHSGQKIALVGASGAGKSTLMSVLRGLYIAQSGALRIDATEFDTISPIASLSTLIPQEPEIFENTIRYNVTLGLDHSDTEIMDACRIACFDTVVNELPKGLDSAINEKGVNLSGGQKQRLALARGIFAIEQSSIVLFDEPTSSVDSMTERRMYQNLFSSFPNICLISSIHRLNLLPLFDTIWVMEHGRLVQQGTIEALLAEKTKPFYRLWSAYQQNPTETE